MSFIKELKRRNVIRVALAYILISWVLLQAADFGLDLIDAPNWVIQALVMLAALGLVAVLIFSWVFEMTPEGIKKEKEIDRTESITPQTGRKLDRVIIGALGLLVVYLLVDKLVLEDASTPVESTAAPTSVPAPDIVTASAVPASVAVLPFVNMSNSEENEYFSDGLTETLLHMLAQLPDLQVAARTSSFAFKGQNKSVGEIAEVLGVQHILEGSVQRASGQMRITAQLVRADDGFHVWSQNYTRPVEDIFAIQDEIATDVANALGASLLGQDESLHGLETENLTAYDSYLKGLEEQARFSYISLPKAESHFKDALAADPTFTDATLAQIRNNVLAASTGIISFEEMETTNGQLIAQVRTSDPNNRMARAYELAMGLRPSADQRIEQVSAAVAELRELLAYLPTETMIRQYVANTLAGFFQDHESALEVLQAGLLVDPLDGNLHATMGTIQLQNDLLDEAEVSLRTAIELQPDSPNHYWDLHDLEKERNNIVAALNWARQASEVDPQDHEYAAQLAKDMYLLQFPEEGDRWLARASALAPGSAVVRSAEVDKAWAMGDTDAAMDLALAMIRDDVEERHGSYFSAVGTYGIEMIKLGKAEEAFTTLAELQPALNDYSQTAPNFKGMITQWLGIGLKAGFQPYDEVSGDWQTFTANLNAMGVPWLQEDDTSMTWNLLLTGKSEEAIDQYLAGPLNRPQADNIRMHYPIFESLMQPVYDDPRVVTRMAELERSYQDMRIEVQEMLQQPEWSQ